MKLLQTQEYLLLIDKGAEIKGTVCLCYNSIKSTWGEDIILYQGTMPDYHFIGFQKIIAYRKLNEEAKELDLPELPLFEKEDENIKKLADDLYWTVGNDGISSKDSFIKGYKAAQSKQFSLEDMNKAIAFGFGICRKEDRAPFNLEIIEFIQSLSTQQLPKEFIPDTSTNGKIPNYPGQRFKTITNSEGKQEIQGKYIW